MKPKEDRPHRVLIVDDSPTIGEGLRLLISHEGFVASSVTSIEGAKKVLAAEPFDLVITDPVLTSSGIENIQSGIDFILWLKRDHPQISIIASPGSVSQHLPNLSDLGVSIVARENPVYVLIQAMQDALSGQVVVQSAPPKMPHDEQRDMIVEARLRMFSEEMAKLLALKERVLTLPDEGTYELPKPLQGFKKDIERHISKFPFKQNVFLMMKFRSTNRDVADFIIDTLQRRGFRAVRADDREWNITRNIYNPIAVLYCCKYGVALFDEPEDHQAYSPNVAYELGIMHQQNKECLILKHALLPQVPFDLIKDLYQPYDRDLQLRQIIEHWTDTIAGASPP